LGGINDNNYGSGYFITGEFQSCEMKFRISGDFSDTGIPWGTTNIKGFRNTVFIVGGGGGYNVNNGNNQPFSLLPARNTSVSNNTFASSPPWDNKLTLQYNIANGASIPPNGLLTLYAYSPWTDGYTYNSPTTAPNTATSASNNFVATSFSNLGLVFEGAVDNNANNPNEIIMYFRNVSGSTLSSGNFNFILSIGL